MLATLGPLVVERDGLWQGTLTFVPRRPGDDTAISIVLEREGVSGVYRTVRLWLDVAPAT
jgi:hypothetical protein